MRKITGIIWASYVTKYVVICASYRFAFVIGYSYSRGIIVFGNLVFMLDISTFRFYCLSVMDAIRTILYDGLCLEIDDFFHDICFNGMKILTQLQFANSSRSSLGPISQS